LSSTTVQQREEWFQVKDSSLGQNLTDQIPALNTVEIDNTVSPKDECRGRKLRVMEFNAARGKRWLEAADLLKGADIIILNGSI
jgi:hypothetical protein